MCIMILRDTFCTALAIHAGAVQNLMDVLFVELFLKAYGA